MKYRQINPAPVTHAFFAAGGATYIRSGSGEILWEFPHATRDGWVLPSGNVILALNRSQKYPNGGIAEVDKKGNVLFDWQGTQSEVNTVQDIGKGRLLTTEAGDKPRILEIEKKTGKIVAEVPLQAQTKDHHLQTRMTRKLRNGNYLVPQLLDKVVREYTPQGKIVWEAKTPGQDTPALTWAFTAIRLDNGNTLTGCTLSNITVEFDKKGKIVWQVTNEELENHPFNDCCGVQKLSNGNTVITAHHATGNEVKLVEITREKKIVWEHRDATKPGIHHFQILDTNGKPIKGRPLK
jgi:outer membrane protein assembly factor BamB